MDDGARGNIIGNFIEVLLLKFFFIELRIRPYGHVTNGEQLPMRLCRIAYAAEVVLVVLVACLVQLHVLIGRFPLADGSLRRRSCETSLVVVPGSHSVTIGVLLGLV